MLLGQYDVRLDEKNRLTVPVRLRPAFAAGIVVTRGLDGCLYAFTRDGWEQFHAERIVRLDSFAGEARVMRRFFFSGAHESELDRQGRVALPGHLLDHAGLAREITVSGVGDMLEIWDRDAWLRAVAESEGKVEDVAERFARDAAG